MNRMNRLATYKGRPGSLVIRLLVDLSALLTVIVLISLVGYILIKGVPNLHLSLFQWTYNTENVSMMPAIINTLTITLLSLLVAVPFGVFSAVYLVEYAGKGNKLVKIIRLTTETLSGIPSIVYGLFGFLMFVVALGWSYSILAGTMIMV